MDKKSEHTTISQGKISLDFKTVGEKIHVKILGNFYIPPLKKVEFLNYLELFIDDICI